MMAIFTNPFLSSFQAIVTLYLLSRSHHSYRSNLYCLLSDTNRLQHSIDIANHSILVHMDTSWDVSSNRLNLKAHHRSYQDENSIPVLSSDLPEMLRTRSIPVLTNGSKNRFDYFSFGLGTLILMAITATVVIQWLF